MKRLTIPAIAAYGAIALLTFAYVFQHPAAGQTYQATASYFAAVGWPIYWGLRLALLITEGWTF